MRTVRKEKAKKQVRRPRNGTRPTLPALVPLAKAYDVVGLGENSVDLLAVADRFPRADTKQLLARYDRLVGGQAASAMVGCARLGWRARYVGVIGDDDDGRQVASTLAEEGVDAALIRRAGASTRGAVILVEKNTGRRTVLEHRDPRVAMTAGEIDTATVTSGRILLLDARDPSVSLVAARAARAAGVPVVLDIECVAAGVDELLRHVDVIVAAEAFPSAMMGRATPARALARLGEKYRPMLAVVTLGAEGSIAWVAGRVIKTRGFKVAAVDTTGAGDAFRSGLMAAWLEARGAADVATVLEYANAVAALNCLGFGAQAGLPTKPEVLAFVTRSGRAQSK
jgi:sulfofructose kinase